MRCKWLSACAAVSAVAACGGVAGEGSSDARSSDASVDGIEEAYAREVALADRAAICAEQVPFSPTCGCLVVDMLVAVEPGTGPDRCRYTLPLCADYRRDALAVHVDVDGHPEDFFTLVSGPEQCVERGVYVVLGEYPLTIVFCPATCESLQASGATVRITQGCPAIVCR